jgi:hypothetical protein
MSKYHSPTLACCVFHVIYAKSFANEVHTSFKRSTHLFLSFKRTCLCNFVNKVQTVSDLHYNDFDPSLFYAKSKTMYYVLMLNWTINRAWTNHELYKIVFHIINYKKKYENINNTLLCMWAIPRIVVD